MASKSARFVADEVNGQSDSLASAWTLIYQRIGFCKTNFWARLNRFVFNEMLAQWMDVTDVTL